MSTLDCLDRALTPIDIQELIGCLLPSLEWYSWTASVATLLAGVYLIRKQPHGKYIETGLKLASFYTGLVVAQALGYLAVTSRLPLPPNTIERGLLAAGGLLILIEVCIITFGDTPLGRRMRRWKEKVSGGSAQIPSSHPLAADLDRISHLIDRLGGAGTGGVDDAQVEFTRCHRAILRVLSRLPDTQELHDALSSRGCKCQDLFTQAASGDEVKQALRVEVARYEGDLRGAIQRTTANPTPMETTPPTE